MNGLACLKVLAALVLMILYVCGANYHAKYLNTDIGVTDQSSYVKFTQRVHNTNGEFTGGRNRMPLYAQAQSLFVREGMSNEDLFVQGKRLNIVLSLLILILLYPLLRMHFSQRGVWHLILVYAFTVSIFKAGYYQSEILFYYLNFLVFLGFFHLIRNPRYLLALGLGIVMGLAHLTKASVLPGLAICSFVLLIEIASKRGRLKTVLCLGALIATFLLVVSPYILESKAQYGRYFYNVNTTFAMWTDSLDEYQREARDYGDRKGWPDRPLQELPSPQKYLSEHSILDIALRIMKYGKGVIREALESYGYHYFVLLGLVFLLLAHVKQRKDGQDKINLFSGLGLFVPLYFSCYFLLYAWYGPIELGNRLFLSQFLPLMFVIFWVIEKKSSLAIHFHRLGFLMLIVLAWPFTQRLISQTSGS